MKNILAIISSDNCCPTIYDTKSISEVKLPSNATDIQRGNEIIIFKINKTQYLLTFKEEQT